MTAARALLAMLALAGLAPPQGAGATSVRPVMYGPWGRLCLADAGAGQALRCTIRYQLGEHEVQWAVSLQQDGAAVLTWGRNRHNCREAQVTERVDRNYRLARPTLAAGEVAGFADGVLQVMRSHAEFFGDCYNPRGRPEAISPAVLAAASPDFRRAFVDAENALHVAALRAEAAEGAP